MLHRLYIHCVFFLYLVPAQQLLAHAPHDDVSGLALAQTQEQTYIFLSSRGFLRRSSDLGKSWQFITNGLSNRTGITSISTSPITGQNIVATAGKQIFYSSNAGDSWAESQVPSRGSNIVQVSFSQFTKNVAGALSQKGDLFISSDSGEKWSRHKIPAPITTFAFVQKPSELLVLQNDSLYRLHLTDQKLPPKKLKVCSNFDTTTSESKSLITVNTSSTKALVLCTNGHLTMLDLRTDRIEPLAHPSSSIQDVQFLDESTLGLVDANDGFFFLNIDKGDWIQQSQNLQFVKQADQMQRARFSQLAVFRNHSESQPNILLGGFDGLFSLSKLDSSWQPIPFEITSAITDVYVYPDYCNSGKIIVSTYLAGIFASNDYGETWSPLLKSTPSKVIRAFDSTSVQAEENTEAILTTSWSRCYLTFPNGSSKMIGTADSLKGRPGKKRGRYARPFLVDFDNTHSPPIIIHSNGSVSKFDLATTAFSYLSDVGGRVHGVSYATHSNSSVIRVVSDEVVFESRDFGLSWKAAFQFKKIYCRDISLTFSEGSLRTYLGCRDGLYWQKTSDSALEKYGQGDSKMSLPINAVLPGLPEEKILVDIRGYGLHTNTAKKFLPIEFKFQSPHVSFLGTNNRTYMSLVHGPQMCAQNIFGYSNNKLFLSKDYGFTWSKIFEFPGTYVTKGLDGSKRITLR